MTTQSPPPGQPANPDPPELILLAGYSASITAIAFSPDGRHFATAEGDGQVVLWNFPEGRAVNAWQRENLSAWIGFTAPDELVIHSARRAEILELREGRSSLLGGSFVVLQASQNQLLLVDDRDAYRVRVEEGELVSQVAVPVGEVLRGSYLAISADGGTAASVVGSFVGRRFERWLQVWDLRAERERSRRAIPGKLVWRTRDASGKPKTRETRDLILQLALSPDGRMLAVGGMSTLWLCHTRTGRRSHLLLCYEMPTAVAFSPDGKLVAAGKPDGTVTVWNVRTGAAILSGQGHDAWPSSLAFSPDSKHLISGARDKTLCRWDVETGTYQEVSLRSVRGTRAEAADVLFSPDGRRIATSYEDGSVRFWNARTGELETVIHRHPSDVRELRFSPDGRQLTGGGRRRILYDFETGIGEEAGEPEEAERRPVVSPDGRRMARISEGGKIAIQDAATGKLLHSIIDPDGEDDVSALVFSLDSRTLAAGYEGFRVRLWDVETGRCRQHIRSPEDANYYLAFSPDGRLLTVAGAYGPEVILCDLQRNTQPIRFALTETERQCPESVLSTFGGSPEEIPAPEVSLLGHAGNIRGVCFSPDGRTVATVAADAALKIWDPETGRLLVTMLPLPASDESPSREWISFTPEGHYISSSGAVNWIRWQVGEELLPAEAFASEYNAPDQVARAVRGQGESSRSNPY